MGSGSFDVRRILSDVRLDERLRIVAERFGPGYVYSKFLDAEQETLNAVRLLVCDATLVDIAALRAAAPQAMLIAVLPAGSSEALADRVFASADEVWFQPAPLAYAERRFAAALELLQERRTAKITRIQLDTVIDNSPDLIWVKDVRGAHLKVNNAFCDAVGKTKQQIEGRGHYYIWDIAPDEYATGEFVCLETEEIVLNRRTRCLFDEKVLCKQGLRQFKTYKSPLIDDNGTLLGTVGVAQDVTRHIQTTSRLSERMASITAAINTAHVYHWRFNPVTQVAKIGHVFASELGLPAVLENYPYSLMERGIIHKDSMQSCLRMHKALLEKKNDGFYDVQMCMPDGSDRWKRIRYRYVESEDGDGEFLGIGEDITDYKRMEKYLIISARQNGITTWIYDIENSCVYSIVDPLNALGLQKGVVEDVPGVFSRTRRLHPDDLPAVLELHDKIIRGERTASAIVRWNITGSAGWSWFKLSYTTIFSTTGEPVRAIGSALDINEQVKAEHLYAMQLAYRDSTARHSHGTLLLNLSKNTISEGGGKLTVPPGSVDNLFRDITSRPYLAEHAEMCAFFNRQRMLENFDKNITLERLQHPYRNSADDGIIWVQSTVNTIRNPDTGDVEAFIQIKDIDEHKVMEDCFSAAAIQDNEALVCVNLHTGTFRLIYSRGQFVKSAASAQRPYHAEIVENPLPLIPEHQRDKHRQTMRLENVEERLQKQNRYTVHGSTFDGEGCLRQKRVRFTWLDKPRGLVCMAVSDTTDAFEAERRKNVVLRKALTSAKDSSRAKSAFLANMSHEIRTPMNTILGMSQILLGKSLMPEVTDGILAIQSASNGLLAIINDILDFSKVESGKFTLQEGPYMLASLLMDMSSLIAVRLSENPILFLININPDIPVTLRGDDTRLRQILSNIVGNAVKYTPHGSISLDVSGTRLPDGNFRLEMQVTDTGIGIREEDLPLLFEQFSRVDTTRNRHVTGTGLGLALSRGFARLMGGDITVTSRYGEGSTFTITVVQGVEQDEPIARVKVRGQCILVYEPDEMLAGALSQSLEQLDIGYIVCRDMTELVKVAASHHITHAVVRRKNYGAVAQLLAPLCLESNLILLLENAEIADASHMRHKQMQLPLFCLQIADFLNGETRFAESRRMGFDTSTITPLPGMRVLVVDDSITNLKVVKGLLAPYRMQVDTVTSGFEALEMVQCQQYDLIFMDHMMPELDGVETATRIRALGGEYCSTVPIVALTANAMQGAREMFLQQGLTDFLAKPVEISKLHRIIKTWIEPVARAGAAPVPRPVPVDRQSVGAIEELNTDKALATYGDAALYRDVLATYASDMGSRIPELRHYWERKDVEALTISVHAIKSASRSVGADALGDMAEALEYMGLSGDIKGMEARFDPFMDLLQRVTKRVSSSIKRNDSGTTAVVSKPFRDDFDPDLKKALQSACEDMDYVLAERLLEELDVCTYPEALEKHLTRMKECCAEFDYALLDQLVQTVQ